MKPWTDGKPGEWAWLCHHGLLLEMLGEPSANRVEYINLKKPTHERQVRLAWFRPVLQPERLPKAVVTARAAYERAWAAYGKALGAYYKARVAYDKARAAYDKARAAYVKAIDDHWDEIVALHREEYPGCPFDYEKRTLVFGGKP